MTKLQTFLKENQKLDVDINGIYDSFKKKSTWDIVYANGHNSGGRFYDCYAFRDPAHLFGPEITGEYFWNHLPILNFNKETKLIICSN